MKGCTSAAPMLLVDTTTALFTSSHNVLRQINKKQHEHREQIMCLVFVRDVMSHIKIHSPSKQAKIQFSSMQKYKQKWLWKWKSAEGLLVELEGCVGGPGCVTQSVQSSGDAFGSTAENSNTLAEKHTLIRVRGNSFAVRLLTFTHCWLLLPISSIRAFHLGRPSCSLVARGLYFSSRKLWTSKHVSKERSSRKKLYYWNCLYLYRRFVSLHLIDYCFVLQGWNSALLKLVVKICNYLEMTLKYFLLVFEKCTMWLSYGLFGYK